MGTLNPKKLRELEKVKGNYLISYPESWYEENPGVFPVDAVVVSYDKTEIIPSHGEKMSKLFEVLGFRVTVLEDKSSDELKAELRKLAKNNNDESPLNEDFTNCFVCFVNAYGNTTHDGRQFILDHNCNRVDVKEDIIEPFMTCKALEGKPKVFFINSCIVKCKPSTEPPDMNRRRRKVMKNSDLLAVFSTEKENPDGRDPFNEVSFVEKLVDSLHKNHNVDHVWQIITDANRFCKSASVTCTLTNHLFWKTGRLDDVSGIVEPQDPMGTKRMMLVYKTPEQTPELDIVLFHGYEFGVRGGHLAALSSWLTKSTMPVCWPVEWLPSELGGIPMRVFFVKYSHSVDNPEPCSSNQSLNELAEQVRKDLEVLAARPLIFIAHGLGGLLIQEILNSEGESVQLVRKWLRGIVFYGVPYDLSSGAKNFSFNALENALKQENGYLSVVSKSEIKEAVESPGSMEKARKNFCKNYKGITLSFEEGKETYGSKINMVAVQQYATQVNTIAESCSMCNHFDICRPTTRQEDRTGIFTGLLRFIRKQLHNCDRTDIVVGQDAHFKKLKTWLLTREAKVASVAGITGGDTFGVAGMGGVGKTTLAKSLQYDADIQNYYDHRVYWIAVKREPSIIECQRRLLSEICKEMPSVELGTEELLLVELQKRISKLKKVLLFLDDVWEKEHLDRLFGGSFMDLLPPESKCIITSRKPAELAKLGADEQIEKLDVLTDEDARTLFCSKAFLNGRMPTDKKLRAVVEEVINACGNMPILLATIGADRWGIRIIESWEEVRDRLKGISAENESSDESAKHENLISQVMISYDDLPERDAVSGEGINFKDYFLDFAAFPEREEIEIAVLMDLWTKPGMTEDGAYRILEELEQRCLVKIVGYWCHVHDICRALAVKIVERPELRERKRLFAWGLSENRLPGGWNISRNATSGEAFETEKMVIASSDLKEFHPSDAIIFKYLTRLRMLFLTSNLNLVSLPSAVGHLRSLEKLDLSWCLGLKRLPREIGQLESLEKLSMAGCCSLIEIPAEVGRLKKLVELNLQSCGLERVPDEIGELTRLTYLCLNDCNRLTALPDAMGNLSSLEKLECELLGIEEIPRALGNLRKLKHLSFAACGSITKIPMEFLNLKNLVTLCFVNSQNLWFVPDELEKLVTEGSLRVFDVYNTHVRWENLPRHLHALPKPFDGTIQDDEVDSTADNPDGPYWSHKRGMLVNTTSLYDPSNKEQRRLSFGLVKVVTLAKNEPFLSRRFKMAIRIMYTMGNYKETRHAIVRAGGVPVLLRCVDKGDLECADYAAATLTNMCVTTSTHKAIVDSPQGLDILTRALQRKDHVAYSVFQALLWIRAGDRIEKDFTYYSEILEKCGHTDGHQGCACIFCQHCDGTFLEIKNVF